MVEYKLLLGYITVIISFGSYVPYFRGIIANKIKPHAFSWFIWGLLAAIAFAAQITEHGGAGAWVTASTTLACLAIAILALVKGQRTFTPFDWAALVASLLAIVIWIFTKSPVFSVILVTITNAVGFLPTFRKGYDKPMEESAALYSWSMLKYAISLFALQSFTISTWLFPASLVLSNGLFVAMLLVRRKVKH